MRSTLGKKMKTDQLFNITNEEIANLPSVPLIDRDQLPATSGLYFALSDDDTIYYIGRSRDMRTRWLRHHRHEQLQDIMGIRLAFIAVDQDHILAALERSLIERFKPVINDIFAKPDPSFDDVHAIFEDPIVAEYLSNPIGSMPNALKEAIKHFSDSSCAYCGSANYDYRKIGIEIFDAELLASTRDFIYTGVICNSCRVTRGAGSTANAIKVRELLYERITGALDKVISYAEPFGIDISDVTRLREGLTSDSLIFHNPTANTISKKPNKPRHATTTSRPV
jgi:hypothetical protein